MIHSIDHIVITCSNLSATIDFYTRVLGMEAITFAGGRRGLAALQFQVQIKILFG